MLLVACCLLLVACCVLLLGSRFLLLRGPHTAAAGHSGQTQQGRRAWMRDVFQRDMDVPLKNSRTACGPGAPQARRARGRGVLSFGYFSLHKQRKATRARRA
ncbi:hypothetical protein DEF98_019915 [Xanthomonas vasicola]|nr:hypothetical protein DEF98_019915 [Xanthomonas vasicola]